MARQLTLEFKGLCAYVRDREAPDPAGLLTVLMLDPEKAGMRGHPFHAPEMEIPSRAIRGRNGKGSRNGTSVLNLAGRGVQIQATGGRLTFAPDFQKVPSLESIRSGYGRVDSQSMKGKRPRRVVASRIQMTGGRVTAKPQRSFARKEWRFQPPPAKASGPRVLADTVRVTVAGKSGPFTIVLTDLKTGKVKRRVNLEPSAAATIEFRNEPVHTPTGNAHRGVLVDGRADHFAACYEVSAKGRGLRKGKRPVPVLASAGHASGHAHQGHQRHQGKMHEPVQAEVAAGSTVFCPGAALYGP